MYKKKKKQFGTSSLRSIDQSICFQLNFVRIMNACLDCFSALLWKIVLFLWPIEKKTIELKWCKKTVLYMVCPVALENENFHLRYSKQKYYRELHTVSNSDWMASNKFHFDWNLVQDCKEITAKSKCVWYCGRPLWFVIHLHGSFFFFFSSLSLFNFAYVYFPSTSILLSTHLTSNFIKMVAKPILTRL